MSGRMFPRFHSGGSESFNFGLPLDLVSQVRGTTIARDADAAYTLDGQRYKNKTKGLARWSLDGTKPEWEQPLRDRIAGRALLKTRDKVIVAAFHDRDKQGYLLIYNAADGKLLSDTPFDGVPLVDALAAADGRIVLTTLDGGVVAFGDGN